MKAFTVVAALSFALVTVPAMAQTKPTTQKPPATSPTQKPVTPPAPTTQKPATPAPQAQPPRPFPEGAKVAFCSLQWVVANSKEGKAFAEKIKSAQDAKLKAIQDKQKAMEANQSLLQSPALADDKRAALSKEVERQNVEIQRMQQDAQAEIQELNNESQDNFLKKVLPIIQQVATEKGVQMVMNYQDGLFLWADGGLDLSPEVARRLDAGTTPAK